MYSRVVPTHSQLILAITLTNNPDLNNKFIEHGILGSILDLFKQYVWNNFLHQTVAQIISLVLTSSDATLKRSVFQKTRLHEFVAEVATEGSQSDSLVNSRKGYMGFLTEIAGNIEEVLSDILISVNLLFC